MKAFCSILCGFVATGAAFTPFFEATAKPVAAKTTATAKPYDEHVVKKGETLWSIAQAHNTSVGEIMDYNHLPTQTVRDGTPLKIPHRATESPRNARQHIHIMQEGQSFWSIADDYGVSHEGLAKANPDVNPSRIHEDMELVIPAEEPDSLQEKAKITTKPTAPVVPNQTAVGKGTLHTVAEKETFYSIGKKYEVSPASLMAANPSVKPERLRSGMQVVIPNGKAPSSPVPASGSKTTALTKPKSSGSGPLHTVKERESVSSISRKYGISEKSLMQTNRLKAQDILHPGDILTIPSTSAKQAPGPGKTETARLNQRSFAPTPASKPVASRPSFAPAQSLDKPSPVLSAPISSKSPAAKGGTVQSYVVSAGENEHTIAEAFGITRQQLFDYNRLDNSTSLRAGDEIMIPARR